MGEINDGHGGITTYGGSSLTLGKFSVEELKHYRHWLVDSVDAKETSAPVEPVPEELLPIHEILSKGPFENRVGLALMVLNGEIGYRTSPETEGYCAVLSPSGRNYSD
jgi:hypothetical protein